MCYVGKISMYIIFKQIIFLRVKSSFAKIQSKRDQSESYQR